RLPRGGGQAEITAPRRTPRQGDTAHRQHPGSPEPAPARPALTWRLGLRRRVRGGGGVAVAGLEPAVDISGQLLAFGGFHPPLDGHLVERSEERRVGKECRSRVARGPRRIIAI